MSALDETKRPLVACRLRSLAFSEKLYSSRFFPILKFFWHFVIVNDVGPVFASIRHSSRYGRSQATKEPASFEALESLFSHLLAPLDKERVLNLRILSSVAGRLATIGGKVK